MNTTHTQTETKTLTARRIAYIRNVIACIKDSINDSYLDEDYRELYRSCNYEDIVMTESGYYAHIDDCVCINDEFYHTEQDNDLIVWDERDEEYILSDDSREVFSGRGSFITHVDNCEASCGIFEYQGDYITDGYMERNSLIFDVDGDIAHHDDVYYWESDGEYHHEPEDEDDYDNNGEYRNTRDSIIQSYSYKPVTKFCQLTNDNENTPFFGIELEVERRNSESIKHKDMAELIKNEHWYFKTDGSLTDGFEIVTHPMTFNYIKNASNSFESALKLLVENNYNSYNANTCGMHIHISKKVFSTWHLYRFMKFFVENKDFIVSISQRKLDKLERWANIEDNSNDELIYKAKKKGGNNARYVAINLQNVNTIEIRIFRGTLNFNSFLKNIEFAHSLFMYTKESNEITLGGFKEYISKSCDYSNLKKFIKLKNL